MPFVTKEDQGVSPFKPTVSTFRNASVSTRRDFMGHTVALSAAAAISAPIRGGGANQVTVPTSEAAMKTVRIPNTNLTVGRIAYGCGGLVGADQGSSAGEVLARASTLVLTARDQGITLFDISAGYGRGNAETVLGDVLRRTPGLRAGIVIQTKCGGEDRSDWRQPGDIPFYFDCSGRNILESAERSLRRLGTDTLDILLLHWPDLLVQPEEVAHAFDKLHRDGKVQHFGVSNHTPGQIALLKRYVHQPLVANQIFLGLADSYPIAAGVEQLEEWGAPLLPHGHASMGGVIDYCRLNDIQCRPISRSAES